MKIDATRLSQLASELEQLAELLLSNGVDFWAGRIEEALKRLQAGAPEACDEYLECFRGVGSFSECNIGTGGQVFDRRAPHWRLEGDGLFLKFERLRESSYALAVQLSRTNRKSVFEVHSPIRWWLRATGSTRVLIYVLGILLGLALLGIVRDAGA